MVESSGSNGIRDKPTRRIEGRLADWIDFQDSPGQSPNSGRRPNGEAFGNRSRPGSLKRVPKIYFAKSPFGASKD